MQKRRSHCHRRHCRRGEGRKIHCRCSINKQHVTLCYLFVYELCILQFSWQ